ncbi:MAG: GEVED domain-containing protein [Weeksellaceae bacterium]
MKKDLFLTKFSLILIPVFFALSVSAEAFWRNPAMQNEEYSKTNNLLSAESIFQNSFSWNSLSGNFNLNAPDSVDGILFAGESCGDPIQVLALPFTDAGNTSDYGNNYTNSDVPPLATGAITNGTGSNYYISGPEAVYAITPTADGVITINTTNADDWVGLWVFTGCPFTSTVGYHTAISGSTRSIPDLPVFANETYYIVISTWESVTPNTDYTIEITGSPDILGPLEDCEGTPDGGTASVNPESGNMGSTYTVTATGYSYGLGMSYQWQSNTDDAGWVDEGDATENYASYTATAPDILGVEVAWRLAITCTLSGETSYSETAVFTTVITYCQPSFSSSSDYIVSFVLENIQNTDSGFSPGGYGDFTSMSTVLASPSYEATLTSSSGSGNHGAAIWIDANDNGTFELSERVGFLSNIGASQTVQIPISIAGVATGEHRMRVVYQYNVAGDTIDPCVSASFGEAEDYTVIIGELDDCTGTPDPGTVSVNPESGNPGMTYIVSSTGYTYGNGLSYQWQSNLNDTGWVDEGEASEFYSNYTATAPGELNDTVDWRLVLTCNNSGESATSNVATFVVDRLHCTPEGTNAARYINDFTTTDGLENISNLNSGFSPGGYGDFYNDYQIVQVPGQEVSFNAVFEGGTFGFRIWVDWNEDGTFSADEVMYASSSYISSQNGTFQVPTNATPGEKRMRIVNHWLSATGDIDPCATGFTYGEFEDYKFVVGELEDCEGTPNGGNITITPSEGNPDSIYTVSASGYSYGNGLSYQWQSNTDGNGWVDEGEATDYYMDYTATAPGVVGINVEWRLQVTCTLSGESSFSDTATFTTTIVYCVPSFSSTSDFIQSFELEEIQNINSGFSPGGYGDFTAMSTMLTNPEHTASLTSSSGSGSHGAAIWIDFNDNGTFEDAERVGFASGIQPNQTVDITMDLADAIPGEHRMRIIYQWNVAGDIINPCVSASFGEAEDYTVIIGEPEPCEGTPEAGTVSVDPAFGNPGSTYTVKSSGYSFALDLTFQWQSNTEDAGWVNEGELLTQYAHHLATAPTQPNVSVDWRLIVTCLNSGETTTSNEATFTTVMPGCGHETPSNNLEDAHGNLHLLEIANDFVVNVNQRFLVDVAEINLVIPTGVPVDAADFRFYADTGNGPGEEVVSNLAVAPTSVTVIMNTGGFTLAKYLFNLEGIVLDGNDTTETVYWMGVSIDANVSASYWEVTSTINSDNEEYIYLDGMWQTSTEVFQEPMDGVMKLQGSCETLPTNDLLAFDFAYYPNPVRDVLNITSKAGIQSVTAYNLAGQQVLNLNGDKLNSGQIDVTTLPQGVYVFRTILEGGQVETFKIVKK